MPGRRAQPRSDDTMTSSQAAVVSSTALESAVADASSLCMVYSLLKAPATPTFRRT
jgi:hypothetical protein